MIDMTNKIFNKWTVIEQAGKSPKNEILWLCKCECGTQKIINGCDLRRNRTKSCGCDKDNDYLHQKFGKWTVLKRVANKNDKRVFLCQCECGTIKEVVGQSLKNGVSLSCGQCNHTSLGEQKIENLLKTNNIKYEKEKVFNNFYFSDSERKPRFDFYIEDKYIVEFDGIQHFKSNGGWNTEDKVKLTQKRDKIKNEYCLNNGIPIIRIPYTHLNNLQLEDILLETSTFLIKAENI